MLSVAPVPTIVRPSAAVAKLTSTVPDRTSRLLAVMKLLAVSEIVNDEPLLTLKSCVVSL